MQLLNEICLSRSSAYALLTLDMVLVYASTQFNIRAPAEFSLVVTHRSAGFSLVVTHRSAGFSLVVTHRSAVF